MSDDYPLRYSVDYPDRDLNRLTTAFRIFTIIPIAIVLASIGGYTAGGDYDGGGGTPRSRSAAPASCSFLRC